MHSTTSFISTRPDKPREHYDNSRKDISSFAREARSILVDSKYYIRPPDHEELPQEQIDEG